MTTPLASPSSSLGSRLLAGVGTLALLAGVGLMSSRPAHTAGGPVPVNVANTVLVRNPDGPARQPFQRGNIVRFTGTAASDTFSVPAGKRLLIESLTVSDDVSSSQNSYSVSLFSGTGEAGLSLTPDGAPYPVKTQPVRLTAEAGDSVSISISSNAVANAANVYVSVSGYYVDVP